MIRSVAAALLIPLVAAPALAQPTCLPYPWHETGLPDAADAAILALARWLQPTFAAAPALSAAVALVAPDLCLSTHLDGTLGFLDAEPPQIVVDVGATPALQRGILLHELQHLGQLARGFCPGNALSPQDNARATFAMEADASAVSLLLAWQRREQGDASAWDALAGWPQQADIAARFARDVQAGQDVPAAVAAAFAQWYAQPDRRERYYRASCSDYLDREDQGHLLRGSAPLPSDFFARLCILPDGRGYPCVEPEFGLP